MLRLLVPRLSVGKQLIHLSPRKKLNISTRTMTTNITDLFTDEASNGILDLWFADAGPYPTHEQAMRWFKADEGFDEEIRYIFPPHYHYPRMRTRYILTLPQH